MKSTSNFLLSEKVSLPLSRKQEAVADLEWCDGKRIQNKC
jgi:hypothetical protein